MSVLELTGQKFGKLLVLSRHFENYKGKESQWVCKCDCENKVIIKGWTLTGDEKWKV